MRKKNKEEEEGGIHKAIMSMCCDEPVLPNNPLSFSVMSIRS